MHKHPCEWELLPLLPHLSKPFHRLVRGWLGRRATTITGRPPKTKVRYPSIRHAAAATTLAQQQGALAQCGTVMSRCGGALVPFLAGEMDGAADARHEEGEMDWMGNKDG